MLGGAQRGAAIGAEIRQEASTNGAGGVAKVLTREVGTEVINLAVTVGLVKAAGALSGGGAGAPAESLGPHAPADVPNSYTVVRGGQSELPPAGTTFSGATGPDAASAANGVPHGKVQVTTAGAIREGGGSVELVPEVNPKTGATNYQHVNVQEGQKPGGFSKPIPKKELNN